MTETSSPLTPYPSPSLSFEFFPPKTEKQVGTLQRSCVELAEVDPEYFSVTFGAGGSTREGTARTVLDVKERTGLDVAPHISCIGAEPDVILALLRRYKDNGIKRLVALRGDIPSGMGTYGRLRYASDLVAFIREHTGDFFRIEVGCYPEFHPQAENAEADMQHFKQKMEAGADAAITQYFFNPDAYFRFLDACERRHIDATIVPGVMPITNYKQIARFSDACGAEIPRHIRKRLEAYDGDLDSLRAYGEEVVTELCRKLLEGGAPGVHFYTLNRSRPTLAILRNLGLPEPARVDETG